MVWGDFNTIKDSQLDRSQVTTTPAIHVQIKDYLKNLGWREISN